MAQAPAQNMIDIIYLKDGGVIRGVILEKVEGDYVRILTGRKTKQTVKFSEIEKLHQEEMNEISVTHTSGSQGKTRYALQADLGFLKDFKDTSLSRIQVDIVNAFRVSPYLSFGLGMGVRFYTGARDLLIPVYGNVRLKLLDRKLSPFFSISYGYSFDSSNDKEGISFTGIGSLWRVQAGLSVQTFRKSYLCAGFQHEVQQFRQASLADSYFYSASGASGDFRSAALGFFVGYGF